MAPADVHDVLSEQLDRLRLLTYAQLVERVPPRRRRILGLVTRVLDEDEERFEVEGTGGVGYAVQVRVFWDAADGGEVRVMVAVSGGGRSFTRPLTGDFIVAPDGRFVDE